MRRLPVRRAQAWRLMLAAILGCALALSLAVQPTSAHAVLLSTSPADGEVIEELPEAAELRFNESVQLIDGAIRLFPGDGEPILLDASTSDQSVLITLPTELDRGTYTLSYRVVSADGHPVDGAIVFHLGEPSSSGGTTVPLDSATPASTESAVVILTALQYLGLLVFAGLLCFDRLVRRGGGGGRRWYRRAWLLSFGVGAVASLLLIPASALRIVGEPLAAVGAVSGWLGAVQSQPLIVAGIVLLAGGIALALSRRGDGAQSCDASGRRASARASLTVAFAAVAVSMPVLVGHTQTREPGWLIVAADIGHLLAAAFWTGGVIGLLRSLGSVHPGAEDGADRVREAIETTSRFSRYALWSVVLLAVSGTVMTLLILDEPSQLLETGYGRTLLIKLGIVLAVVLLGAWNRKRLLPQIAAKPTTRMRWAGLRRLLAYEAALIVTIVAITGYLSNASPDHQHHTAEAQPTAPQELEVRAESQGLLVDGILGPAFAGENTLTFSLEYEGEPLRSEEVQVSARLPEQGLGPLPAEVVLDPQSGDYRAQLTLPVAGEWQIEITARVSTYAQPIALISVPIA
ncbi:Copper resistance protein CopC [Gulosibacter sp. 10]|nr:Copper resistance protein CopC [Gulosibacter sp. 10]